jgi:hypothetical protein
VNSRYRIYMASDAWSQSPARWEALRSAGFRCRICNASSSQLLLHAHHRTYARLEAELPDDLTALCEICHHDVTNFLRARHYASVQPLTPVDIVVEDRAPLFDASIAGAPE